MGRFDEIMADKAAWEIIEKAEDEEYKEDEFFQASKCATDLIELFESVTGTFIC